MAVSVLLTPLVVLALPLAAFVVKYNQAVENDDISDVNFEKDTNWSPGY